VKVRQMIRVIRGELISGDPNLNIEPSKISTDSRTIRNGEFFLALKGTNFNGDDFIGDVFKKGASGAVIENLKENFKTLCRTKADIRAKVIIKAADTTKALQDIASYHRRRFDIPVITVTGSNGKTTVKDIISHLLSAKYNVLKNEGTKNNHIGVPQAILKLNPSHDICVLELGANHAGELKSLAKISRPDLAVITNIGPSHLEFFKDLEGVFRAKREILEYLRVDGRLIINGDDPFLTRIVSLKHKIVKFGLTETNDFFASDIAAKKREIGFLLNGRHSFRLRLLGIHNVYNALASIAAASHFGLGYKTLKKAILSYKPSRMRLNIKRIGGIDVIDDSYNSNPSSMRRALESLKLYPARSRWVVSGDMLELGAAERYFHEEIGALIAGLRFNGLVTFGDLSRYTYSSAARSGMNRDRLWHCATHDDIRRLLNKFLKKGDAVLIKGSRGMRMEEVVNKLEARSSKLEA